MTETDELEGSELARVVMSERGGVQIPDFHDGSLYALNGDELTITPDKIVAFRVKFGGQVENRPDLNIEQAWELDGEGWRWEFAERALYLMVTVKSDDRDGVYFKRYTGVDWYDFPTKSAAYATARCRAFLKAKAAQLDQADGGRGVRER